MLSPVIQKCFVGTLTLALGLSLMVWEPVSFPTTLDFSQLYVSLERAYDGGALYRLDRALDAPTSGDGELQGAFPFAGPPWYLALLIPLGVLSPQKAAFAWALLNVGFLFLTVALIYQRSSARVIALITSSILLSAPAQGHLIVGQFSMIVGVGIALTLWASIHRSHALVAVGLMLTTLRPHLGFPFVLAFLLWTLRGSWAVFGKQVALFLALFAVLLVACVLIDSTSLTSYPGYLVALNSLSVNKVCDTCSSIPIFMTPLQSVAGADIWQVRFLGSLFFGSLLIAPLLLVRQSAPLFVSGTVFGILLSASYLRNYDYVLMVPPLLITAQGAFQVSSTSTRRKVLALLILSTIIAGFLPYLTDRHSQGSYLWLAPLMGYVATTLLIKESSARVRGAV